MALALTQALTLPPTLTLSLALTLALALALALTLTLNQALTQRLSQSLRSFSLLVDRLRLSGNPPITKRSYADEEECLREARGSYRGNAKTRFGTACGSAKEVRAALHIAADWSYIAPSEAERLDSALDTVCAITWSLANR